MADYLNNVRASTFSALGTSASSVLKAAPARVFSFSCTNLNISTRYFHLFNRTTALSGGETPQLSYPVYANAGFLVIDEKYLGFTGRFFNVGLVFGFSTTPLVYTAGTATDAIVEVRFA